MKILKKIANVLFVVIFAAVIGVFAMSTITSRNNHGVPNFFGYQTMVVLTDSMDPTLPVGSGIVAKKVEASTLRPQEKDESGNITYEGDIVTYYSPRISAVVTHRLIELRETDGTYFLVTIGENENSNQCSSHPCVYSPETINESNFLGKVITISNPLGGFLNFIGSPIAMVILIGVPVAYLIFSIIYDVLKKKMGAEETEEEEEEEVDEKK